MGYSLTHPRMRCLKAALHGAAGALLVAVVLLFSVQQAQAAIFGEFTIKDEAELGQKIKASVRNSFPLVEDPEIVAYTGEIFTRLMKQVPPQPFDYSINVIRHNALNAFATPGGNLFLFTGLLLAMDHEAEVAGVLAHEIAHASQRHIANRIAQTQRISLLSLAGAILGGLVGGEGGSALMAGSMAAAQTAQLKYSRADETDADHVGMSYLVKAGYPPRGMVGAFEKIRRQQWLLGSSIPPYLSSHPGVQERINYISTRINMLPASVRNRKYDDAKFLRIQALIRARYSDPSQAMTAFAKQASDTGIQRCYAHMGMGMVHSRQNRIREAESAFEKALSCAPNDALVVREAGIFQYAKGTSAKAQKHLAKAMAENPGDYLAQFYYARLQADAGHLDTALAHYKRILRHLPDDPEIHHFYAQTLGRNKQLFLAHVHMAYSALYANDRQRTVRSLARAKEAAQTPEDQAELKILEEALRERDALFKK